MKPMLARTVGPKFSSYPCYAQPKFNGIRALRQNGLWQSRGEIIWPTNFFCHIDEELNSMGLNEVLLDGELYRHGWKLQRINEAAAVNATVRGPNADTSELEYVIFDIPSLHLKFSDRWFEYYHGIIAAERPHVRAAPTAFIQDKDDMLRHFHLYTKLGYEGIMLRLDGVYEFGEHLGRNGNQTTFRSRNLWKHKQWEDGEYMCVGVTQGEGKADIGVGALVLQVIKPPIFGPESFPTFKVGTGLTDEDRISFMENPPIGKLIRVRFLCLTEEGKPFNPSFIAVMS